MEDKKIMKLTGNPVSSEMEQILNQLEMGKYVNITEIEQTSEIKLARTCISHSIDTIYLQGREELQEKIFEDLNQNGSASGLDETGRMTYNGIVDKNSRLDIVIGLPASGKSSAIVDTISQEFHSRIIDNDEAKKLIPEFNNGWGAGVVHKESKLISDVQYSTAIMEHENIVIPKVGSDVKSLSKYIDEARKEGYHIYVHYVELDRNKALARMLNRFIEEGRFLDPKLIDSYCNEIDGNKIEQCYETLKKGGNLDGYSKWNNDVKRGERPILTEEKCEGEFIKNARTTRTITTNLRDNGRSGVSISQGDGANGYIKKATIERTYEGNEGNLQEYSFRRQIGSNTVTIQAYKIGNEYDEGNYLLSSTDAQNNKISLQVFDKELELISESELSFRTKEAFDQAVQLLPQDICVNENFVKHADSYMRDLIETAYSFRYINADEITNAITKKTQLDLSDENQVQVKQYNKTITVFDTEKNIRIFTKEFDEITDIKNDLQEFKLHSFEIQFEDKVIMKGMLDEDFEEMVMETLVQDDNHEIRERIQPLSKEELVSLVSEVLYSYDLLYKDVYLNQSDVEKDILLTVDAAMASGDSAKLEEIYNRLSKLENGEVGENVLSSIYQCQDAIRQLTETFAHEELEEEKDSQNTVAKIEIGYNTVADIINASLPQLEQNNEIHILLKEQGKSEDFIWSIQQAARINPDIAIQIADHAAISEQSEKTLLKSVNPLNKVEELMEENYNMIDGIINNTPQKDVKEPSILKHNSNEFER